MKNLLVVTLLLLAIPATVYAQDSGGCASPTRIDLEPVNFLQYQTVGRICSIVIHDGVREIKVYPQDMTRNERVSIGWAGTTGVYVQAIQLPKYIYVDVSNRQSAQVYPEPMLTSVYLPLLPSP